MIVSFHPLAERELNDAAQYYEMESRGSVARSSPRSNAAVPRLSSIPKLAMRSMAPCRRRLIARFPYAILYTLRADVVRVVAVMNLKRRPGYWVGRA